MKTTYSRTSHATDYAFHPRLTKIASDLRAQGYEQLGEGCNGAVFHRPHENHVVKVFRDRAYYLYIRKAMRSRNKHFPKAWDLTCTVYTDLKGKPKRIYTVKLEKLASREIDKFGPYIGEDLVERVLKVVLQRPTEVVLDRSLRRAGRHLRKLYVEHDLCVDMYMNNVMLRGNQLVFTDPFC